MLPIHLALTLGPAVPLEVVQMLAPEVGWCAEGCWRWGSLQRWLQRNTVLVGTTVSGNSRELSVRCTFLLAAESAECVAGELQRSHA